MPQPQQSQIQATSVTFSTAHGNAGFLTQWLRPGIEPTSSWILVGFITPWATVRTPWRWGFKFPVCQLYFWYNDIWIMTFIISRVSGCQGPGNSWSSAFLPADVVMWHRGKGMDFGLKSSSVILSKFLNISEHQSYPLRMGHFPWGGWEDSIDNGWQIGEQWMTPLMTFYFHLLQPVVNGLA